MPGSGQYHADAPGVLLILNDVEEGSDAEFNRWYQQQHLPEQLGVAGFTGGRRYQALGAQPAYLAVYECESLAVLSSPSYRQCTANPTDWTRKVMPSLRNMLRAVCRETWTIGDGIGGTAIVVQCKPLQGREADARSFISECLGPRMLQSDCLVRMSLWEADAAAARSRGAEMAPGGAESNYAEWVLFMESYDLGRMALELHAQILGSEAAKAGLLIGSWTRYQLISQRTAASARGGSGLRRNHE